MAGEASLNTVLQIKLDRFQAQLSEAGSLADSAVRDIEDRFSRANPAFGGGLANAIGGLTRGSIEGVLSALGSIVTEFQAIEKAARLTQTSMNDVFAIQQTIGGNSEKVRDAFESVATLLDRAQRGEKNKLADIVSINKDSLADIKTAGDAWNYVIDIIARARTPLRAREFGQDLGISEDVVDNIRKLGDNYQTMFAQVQSGQPDLERLAIAVKQLDDAIKGVIDTVKKYLVDNIHIAFSTIGQTIETTGREIANIAKTLLDFGKSFDSIFNTTTKPGIIQDIYDVGVAIQNVGKQMAAARSNVEAAQVATGLLGGTPFGAGGGGFTAPPAGRAAPARGFSTNRDLTPKAKSTSDELDAFEREQRRATERTETLNKEAELVGKTVEQRTFELEVVRLTQMATRENLTLDEKRVQTIESLADKYAQANKRLDEANRLNRQNVELQNLAGSILVDSLMKATEAGAKFSDIMADIAKLLAKAALQALILGQGPLAGLFGTAPAVAGQTGGAIGGLAALLKGAGLSFQDGGIVPGAGPKLAMVHGGEYVVPPNVARSGAFGGTTLQINQPIDARGAQIGVGEQIAAALDANNRAIRTQLPAMIRDARSRSSL